ncbi:hypothetical protein AAE478_008639 [Parahypoxylon ruwenzoriense]
MRATCDSLSGVNSTLQKHFDRKRDHHLPFDLLAGEAVVVKSRDGADIPHPYSRSHSRIPPSTLYPTMAGLVALGRGHGGSAVWAVAEVLVGGKEALRSDI